MENVICTNDLLELQKHGFLMYFSRENASTPVHTNGISLVQCYKGAGSRMSMFLFSNVSLNEQFAQMLPSELQAFIPMSASKNSYSGSIVTIKAVLSVPL